MKLIPDLSTFTQNLNKNSSDPKSNIHSFELVITVLIFIGVGRLIDMSLGTTPVFLLIFFALGTFGALASAYYRYTLVAKKLEEDKVWNRELQNKKVEILEEKDELIVPSGYGADDE